MGLETKQARLRKNKSSYSDYKWKLSKQTATPERLAFFTHTLLWLSHTCEKHLVSAWDLSQYLSVTKIRTRCSVLENGFNEMRRKGKSFIEEMNTVTFNIRFAGLNHVLKLNHSPSESCFWSLCHQGHMFIQKWSHNFTYSLWNWIESHQPIILVPPCLGYGWGLRGVFSELWWMFCLGSEK